MSRCSYWKKIKLNLWKKSCGRCYAGAVHQTCLLVFILLYATILSLYQICFICLMFVFVLLYSFRFFITSYLSEICACGIKKRRRDIEKTIFEIVLKKVKSCSPFSPRCYPREVDIYFFHFWSVTGCCTWHSGARHSWCACCFPWLGCMRSVAALFFFSLRSSS